VPLVDLCPRRLAFLGLKGSVFQIRHHQKRPEDLLLLTPFASDFVNRLLARAFTLPDDALNKENRDLKNQRQRSNRNPLDKGVPAQILEKGWLPIRVLGH